MVSIFRTSSREPQTIDRTIAAPFVHRRTFTDFRKWNEVDHNKTGVVSYSASTPAEDLFGANASSILAPDNANGPYFVYQELSKLSSNTIYGAAQMTSTATCPAFPDLTFRHTPLLPELPCTYSHAATRPCQTIPFLMRSTDPNPPSPAKRDGRHRRRPPPP